MEENDLVEQQDQENLKKITWKDLVSLKISTKKKLNLIRNILSFL